MRCLPHTRRQHSCAQARDRVTAETGLRMSVRRPLLATQNGTIFDRFLPAHRVVVLPPLMHNVAHLLKLVLQTALAFCDAIGFVRARPPARVISYTTRVFAQPGRGVP